LLTSLLSYIFLLTGGVDSQSERTFP